MSQDSLSPSPIPTPTVSSIAPQLSVSAPAPNPTLAWTWPGPLLDQWTIENSADGITWALWATVTVLTYSGPAAAGFYYRVVGQDSGYNPLTAYSNTVFT